MRGRLSDCGGERAIHGCNPFAVSNALASLEGVRTDLLGRREEITRTLDEVDDVTRRCHDRLSQLGATP